MFVEHRDWRLTITQMPSLMMNFMKKITWLLCYYFYGNEIGGGIMFLNFLMGLELYEVMILNVFLIGILGTIWLTFNINEIIDKIKNQYLSK